MQAVMKKLSVIMPVYNCAGVIEEAIAPFLQIQNLGIQIICIDDGSKDDSLSVLNKLRSSHECIEVIELNKNCGAGIARNIGLKNAIGEFVIFFDADDLANACTIVKALRILETTEIDFAICKYKLGTSIENAHPMTTFDEDIFESALGNEQFRILNPNQIAPFCAITNYPWNKVMRKSFVEHINLKFGDTRVHNDILAHWRSLAFAKSAGVLKDSICTHIVAPDGNNLTNIASSTRNELFSALREIDKLLSEDSEIRLRTLKHFAIFKVNTIKWAMQRIPNSERKQFGKLARESFSFNSFTDFLRLSIETPKVAVEILKFKLQIYP